MNDSVASLSVVSLFLHADIVVKGVLLLLLAASVWSWAVIIDKLWRLATVSRSAQSHEARAAAAHSAAELMAASGEPEGATRPDVCCRRAGPRAPPRRGHPPRPPASGASASSGRCGWC